MTALLHMPTTQSGGLRPLQAGGACDFAHQSEMKRGRAWRRERSFWEPLPQKNHCNSNKEKKKSRAREREERDRRGPGGERGPGREERFPEGTDLCLHFDPV